MRYHTNRQYIYRWMKRYDGTLHSLEDRSHRPHRHPNQHTPEEIKLILNMRHRNPNAGIADMDGSAAHAAGTAPGSGVDCGTEEA